MLFRSISGTHNTVTNEWRFTTEPAAAVAGTTVALLWEPTDTEVIRAEPEPAVAWNRSFGGGTPPVLKHNYTEFEQWVVPLGYQVDLIGNSGFQVQDDVAPGNGVYVNMSGAQEFGRLVSRASFEWVAGATYRVTAELAGNHRVAETSVLEFRFAGGSVTASSEPSDAFANFVGTVVAASPAASPLEIEMIQGVMGSGTLLRRITLTRVDVPTTVLDDNFNGFAIEAGQQVTVLCANAAQVRAEDEAGETLLEFVDDVPWRRDIVIGGELVDVGVYTDAELDCVVESVSDEATVRDQNGVEYRLYSVDSEANPPRVVQSEIPVQEGRRPGRLAVGYKGTLRSLSTVNPTFWETGVVGETEINDERGPILTRAMGGLFTNHDVQLYHVGLVNGVLVADPLSFNGPHHRDGLVLWLPFNEHPEDGLRTADRSSFAQDPAVVALLPTARVWDTVRGWVLRLPEQFHATTSAYRQLDNDGTLSVWLSISRVPTATQEVIRVGNVRCGVTGDSGTSYFGLLDSNGAMTATRFAVTPNAFFFAAVSLTGTLITLSSEYGSASATVSAGFSNSVQVFGGPCPVTLSDLRVWARAKTSDELGRVRDYQPKPTACLYSLPLVESVNHQDRRTFKVLDSGVVILSTPPAVVRNETLSRVRRYDGGGRYLGSARFNEVGLGGGSILPAVWKLGSREVYSLSATGTTVSSGTHGLVGRVGVALPAPSVDRLPAFNSAQDQIWIQGEPTVVRNGAGDVVETARPVYKVSVEAVGTTGSLVASQAIRPGYEDHPTGAVTEVCTSNRRLTVEIGRAHV